MIDGRDECAEEHGPRHVADVADKLPDLPVGERDHLHEPGSPFAALDEEVVAGQRGEDEDEDEAERGGDDRRRSLAQRGGEVAEQLGQAALHACGVEPEPAQERNHVVAQQAGRAAVLVAVGRVAEQVEHARPHHDYGIRNSDAIR